MTRRSVVPAPGELVYTDSPLTIHHYCGGAAGALFVGVVYAVGTLTTITLLGWFVAKFVGRVIRGS